ncbi:MAG: hypothetical protein R3B45_07810 [Bdellovibrionota bacterium]
MILSKQKFRNKALSLSAASLISLLGLAACGGDAADPKIITLDELKRASSLEILDQGNGAIQLSWVGTNSEDDFSGYNVYGAKWTEDFGKALTAAGVEENGALELLDKEGEPKAAAKALLQMMSYNGSDFESPAATEEAPADEEMKFQVFPYYKVKTETVYPTCQPASEFSGSDECIMLTAEPVKRQFIGKTWLKIDGLNPGSKYCFLVLSTLDAGKKVAMASSELRCVTPMVKADDLVVVLNTGSTKHHIIDIEATRDACTASSCTITPKSYGSDCKDNDATGESLCFEIFVAGKPGITGGQFTVLTDFGYFPDGFDDERLMKTSVPILSKLDPNAIAHPGGYSPSAQTVPLLVNHIYIVAHRATEDAEPTSFYYDWYYVKDITHAGNDSTVTFEVRLAKVADAK